MNELIWAILTISGFTATIIVSLAWAIRNVLRSKTGKTLDQAKPKKTHMILCASIGPFAKFRPVKSFMPEGVVETKPFTPQSGRRQQRSIFHLPRKVNLTPEQVQAGKNLEFTKECVQQILDANTQKIFLEDGIPLTVACEDRTVTLNVKGLGAAAFYEKLGKLEDLKSTVDELKNDGEDSKKQKLAEVLLELISRVSLIDLNWVRKAASCNREQTTEAVKGNFMYNLGFRDGQKREKGIEKMIIIGGIAMICGGIAIAIVGLLVK